MLCGYKCSGASNSSWAKSGTGISITDEASRLVIEKEHNGDWHLATVEIGGGDGVREGYFEVELTAGNMSILVGIVKNTGLNHDTYHSNRL